MLEKVCHTTAPPAVVLIRVLVGWVFISEGIQKFLYPEASGAGRFARIGIPMPEVMGPFVGTLEIVCGTLVLSGLITLAAVVPLLVIMAMAIISTKLPVLLGREWGPFSLRKVSYYGDWGMLHEARTDTSMVPGPLFLLIVSAGRWSIDARLARSRKSRAGTS